MREYVACSCARAFADTLQETYLAIGFTDEPELEAVGTLYGTNNPRVIVVDSQIESLEDAEFGEFKLEIASNWKVNSIGLRIERPEPGVFEAHFLIPADADKMAAVYNELPA